MNSNNAFARSNRNSVVALFAGWWAEHIDLVKGVAASRAADEMHSHCWRRGFVVAGCWRMGLRIFGDGGGRRPGYGSAHKQMAQLHPLHGQLS